MLKSAGIALPKTILVNGFLNLNGQKISKSLGNIVKPSDWTKKYGADAVRHYLLRYAVLTEDSDVSEEKLKQAYNSDLANGLGNLVARVAKLCERTGFSFKEKEELKFSKDIKKAIENYQLNEALKIIWNEISDVDKAINNDQPWKIEEKEKLEEKLTCYIKSILQIAYELSPFLPETSKKIQQQFLTGQITSQASLFPRI
jgi:methionyl-tRNA synthetase